MKNPVLIFLHSPQLESSEEEGLQLVYQGIFLKDQAGLALNFLPRWNHFCSLFLLWFMRS